MIYYLGKKKTKLSLIKNFKGFLYLYKSIYRPLCIKEINVRGQKWLPPSSPFNCILDKQSLVSSPDDGKTKFHIVFKKRNVHSVNHFGMHHFQAGTKKQKYERISEKKMSTPVEVLCKVGLKPENIKRAECCGIIRIQELFGKPFSINDIFTNIETI